MNNLHYRFRQQKYKQISLIVLLLISLMAACAPQNNRPFPYLNLLESQSATPTVSPTSLPTRPVYQPGELVDYIAQTGDTLPALAGHFNTTIREIRENNPILPPDVTTLPAGLPMRIPIYYQPLWGSYFQIIPDSLFVNGPAQVGFDPVEFVNAQPGWLKDYRDYVSGEPRRGGELVQSVAENFSVSPRLLLAMIEYQTGALTQTSMPDSDSFQDYPLGFRDPYRKRLYQQLIWAANTLNNVYYGWRIGTFKTFDHLDGSQERPDPWQNAASVALRYYYAQLLPEEAFNHATHADGLIQTYTSLFGDPWESVQPHIPGSLQQPEFRLPFAPGKFWAYTGGPHTAWGTGEPFAAVDFAPPNIKSGCAYTDEPALAIADGVISRTGTGFAILDLDGDGDERTGWAILYLHLATRTIPRVGTRLSAGSPMGLPSCEGGKTTGTHVHIARKFNGEWINADSTLAFNMEDWIAKNGSAAYDGSLVKYGRTVWASSLSDRSSHIQSEKPVEMQPASPLQ